MRNTQNKIADTSFVENRFIFNQEISNVLTIEDDEGQKLGFHRLENGNKVVGVSQLPRIEFRIESQTATDKREIRLVVPHSKRGCSYKCANRGCSCALFACYHATAVEACALCRWQSHHHRRLATPKPRIDQSAACIAGGDSYSCGVDNTVTMRRATVEGKGIDDNFEQKTRLVVCCAYISVW